MRRSRNSFASLSLRTAKSLLQLATVRSLGWRTRRWFSTAIRPQPLITVPTARFLSPGLDVLLTTTNGGLKVVSVESPMMAKCGNYLPGRQVAGLDEREPRAFMRITVGHDRTDRHLEFVAHPHAATLLGRNPVKSGYGCGFLPYLPDHYEDIHVGVAVKLTDDLYFVKNYSIFKQMSPFRIPRATAKNIGQNRNNLGVRLRTRYACVHEYCGGVYLATSPRTCLRGVHRRKRGVDQDVRRLFVDILLNQTGTEANSGEQFVKAGQSLSETRAIGVGWQRASGEASWLGQNLLEGQGPKPGVPNYAALT